MTIACINLSDDAIPISDGEFQKYQIPSSIGSFCAGLTKAIVFTNDKRIPKKITEAIHEMWDGYTVGRCGMRLITSTWVKEKYPNAKYEVVFTLVSEDRNEVHVLLIYLP